MSQLCGHIFRSDIKLEVDNVDGPNNQNVIIKHFQLLLSLLFSILKNAGRFKCQILRFAGDFFGILIKRGNT